MRRRPYFLIAPLAAAMLYAPPELRAQPAPAPKITTPGDSPSQPPASPLRGRVGVGTGNANAGAAGGAGAAPGTPATTPATGAAGGTGGTAKPNPAGGAPTTVGPGGKATADTDKLPQFEQGVEFEPRSPNYKVAFSLEDADLNELVRVIGQLTGKRFIFGGKVRNIKASVYSPQKVTVAEAYQAFLSILETNGLTVIPHGRFLKIVETAGVSSQNTPTYSASQGAPSEDRYVTRMHRLKNVSAEEVSNVLSKFKNKDGDISVYAPGNLLIITDTGTNIRRMMGIIEEIDVGGAGDQIWIEPVHYASASEVASRVNELFDVKTGGAGASPASGKRAGGEAAGGGSAGAGAATAGGGDLHVAKVLPDDRTNSVVIVATEKAYLRILEIIKKIDVPQSAEGEIHVLSLQHADAVELTKTLSEIITGAVAPAAPGAGGRAGAGAAGSTPSPGAPPTGIFEGGVKVSADKSTNSIVVTSSLRDYASLRAVVDRLDKPRRQVFIEAVIMDLSVRRSDSFGVNFHGGSAEDSKNPNDTLIFGGLNPLKTILIPDANSLQGAALGVRGPSIAGTENLLGTGLSVPAFGALINALASTGDADVLSTPHILATDNIAAEINVGENIPLQTNVSATPQIPGVTGAAAGALGALGGLGSFGGSGARQDVGTKIKIIPHLNESNEVRLELTEEISEAKDPQGTLGVVPITKRTAQTQLVVGDQQTVVIGGLMRNRIVHSQEKVPILGDIPVLGALFRTSRNAMEKTNLILILTPYVIREQADLRTIFERKMQERQEFLDRYFVFSDQQEYNPPKDYTRTNGLLETIRQSYQGVEEKKKLDELTQPKELMVHEPGQPLEMPATPRGAGSTPGQPSSGSPATPPATPSTAPATPPAPAGNPNLNVNPAPRSILKEVER
jgi:general secretion pathway protein D